jgi:pyroglutamyl-peptidase
LNRPVLVTGFGRFPGVTDNPSGRAAAAVHGATVRGIPVVGLVLPVRWRIGPLVAIEVARALDARLVLGLGVAAGRTAVDVETVAFRAIDGRPDAAGEVRDLPPGPDEIRATLDVDRLAAALGARTSADAGRYVCNAWLYQVAAALADRPVGFVHVPPEGLSGETLLAGVAALLD